MAAVGSIEDADLLPYVPRLVRSWMLERPDERRTAFDCSVVFVDISGFTRLSERLARLGKIGGEELSAAIGNCFSRLLGVAYAGDGMLIKFGGDALLLLYAGDDHEARACRAAVGMRSTLRSMGPVETPAGNVLLRMSVGVHTGTFHFFLVGGSHRELIVAGPAASETVLMESTASAGEIVVSAATAARLPDAVLGAAKGGGYLLRRAPSGPPAQMSEAETQIGQDTLLECVPIAIRDRLRAGPLEPEHRRVTVAFVHFDGTDSLVNTEGADGLARRIDELVRLVQHEVDGRGVSFLGTDIDHDGGKIILAAGAPQSQGNDEERMLLALRQILDAGPSMPIHVGVNRGHVFAGDIGPPYRRTYTVMGDAVNLAARLMSNAAAGEMLATSDVLERSRSTFSTIALEPFTVKGKRRPVEALSVGAVSGARGADGEDTLPLLGRDDEKALLEAALASARVGSGSVIELVGEAGLGKSRLVEEVRRQAGGARVLRLLSQLYESSTPYFSFREPLRQLLGLSEGQHGAAAAELVLGVLRERAPELLPWAPLLGIVVDVELPPTTETSQLEERFRRPNIHRTTIRLLECLINEPIVWTVEDAQWIDEASAELVSEVCTAAVDRPWFVCVTRREADTGFRAPAGAHVTTVQLTPLPLEAAAALADVVTSESPLPPHAMKTLVRRSGGNPLFLQELIAAAGAAGSLEGLPDSVEALITARIDRLPPEDRETLRYLAVLGQSFPRHLAEAVLPSGLSSDGDVDLSRLDAFLTEDGDVVRFAHALTRDAAYESLSYRLRRRLHSEIGTSIEAAAGDAWDSYAELLSFHFFHAQRDAEAWRYSLAAAEQAQSVYANVAAEEFYQRALKASMRMLDLVPLEVARVHEALGAVRELRGAYADAADAYRAARRFLAGDSVAEARLMFKAARTQGWLGRYASALRSIRRALNILEPVTSQEAARQRAELMAWYGRFCYEAGRPPTAIQWCGRAVEDGTAAGAREAVALAYKVLDWAHMDIGETAKAVYSPQALAIYEELGDLPGQAAMLNNMGALAYWRGHWEDALDLYGRAVELERRTGSEVGVVLARSNIGEILSDQGRWDEAEAVFREALRVWRAVGHRSGMAYAQRNLARVASRQGRHDEALPLFAAVRAEFADVGAQTEVLETDARIAECHVFAGSSEEALRTAESALEHAHALGDVAAQVAFLQRMRGYALLQLSDLERARQAFATSLETARRRSADYEIALTLRGQADLAAVQGLPAAGEATESEAILTRLNVIRVPEAPLVSVTASSDRPEAATPSG